MQWSAPSRWRSPRASTLPVRWNGEEQLAIGPTGQYNKILADQFAQSLRWLANQIEVDLNVSAAKAASRAYGTAGTTPFGTAGDLTDFAGVNRSSMRTAPRRSAVACRRLRCALQP
jgi:hypothetical protein